MIISPGNELYHHSKEVDSDCPGVEFDKYYSKVEWPSSPIRKLIDFLLLMQMYNETLNSLLIDELKFDIGNMVRDTHIFNMRSNENEKELKIQWMYEFKELLINS